MTAPAAVGPVAPGGTPRSSLPRASAGLVRQEVRARVTTWGDVPVLGLRVRAEWDGPERLNVDGTPVEVRVCESALAVREELLDRPAAGWLVLLTERDDADLGDGILSHLAGHRLHLPQPWESVQQAFAAVQVEPRLRSRENRWLAGALLAAAPAEGWPAAPGGTLTRDLALGALSGRLLGLPAEQADAVGLLGWMSDPEALTHWDRALDRAAQDALAGWLAGRCGPGGPLLVAALRHGLGRDAVALGLLGTHLRDGGPDAAGARARLGSRLEGEGDPVPVDDLTALDAWRDAARTVLDRWLADADPRADDTLGRAEVWADRLKLTPVVGSSAVLPRGVDGRLGALAEALEAALGSRPRTGQETAATDAAVGVKSLAQVEDAFLVVVDHVLAPYAAADRRDVARDAVRLVRWLALPVEPARRLSVALEQQVRDGGWVDRALRSVAAGDPAAGEAYGALHTAVRARRDAQDGEVATLLSAAARLPLPPDVLGVEDVVPRVVLPLLSGPARPSRASSLPGAGQETSRGVLLVVVDGMSAAVATTLAESLPRLGLRELVREDDPQRLACVTTFPSETLTSRASLLSARVVRGGQDTEDRGLEQAAGASGVAARLFHENDLRPVEAALPLTREVSGALADPAVGLVAVVCNAVDDSLDKGDPGGTTWDIDTVTHLRPLLQAAVSASRTVVVTSDHGHVVDRRDTDLTPADSELGARCRSATTPAGPREVRLDGERVWSKAGRGAVVLPWDEGVRYRQRHSGYHGGASAAEVSVPVLVFSALTTPPRGWVEAPPQAPAWWLRPIAGPDPRPSVPALDLLPVRSTAASPPPPAPEEDALFGTATPEAEAPRASSVPVTPAAPDLAALLLASDVWRRQAARAGRRAPSETLLGSLLRALAGTRGHRLAPAAVAQAASIPETRLRTTLSAVRDVLNVEGYQVLAVDPGTEAWVLDVPLLRQQFGLPPGGDA